MEGGEGEREEGNEAKEEGKEVGNLRRRMKARVKRKLGEREHKRKMRGRDCKRGREERGYWRRGAPDRGRRGGEERKKEPGLPTTGMCEMATRNGFGFWTSCIIKVSSD